MSSDFYYVQTEFRELGKFPHNQTDRLINWEFKAGQFLDKNFLIGVGWLLQSEIREFQAVSSMGFDKKKFSRFAPFMRFYFYKVLKKRPLFLEFEWAFEKGINEDHFPRTSQESRGNLGLGISYTKFRSLNFEFFVQYSVLKNIKDEFRFLYNYQTADLLISFRMFTLLSKEYLNSKTHYFPNHFEKGTKFAQLNIDLSWLMRLNVGFGFFPAKRWALGMNSTIYFFGELHFESKFFTRYYFPVGPQIQFFGHLAGIYQKQDRIFGIMPINSTTPRNARIFTAGLGMNLMLNHNVGIEWVYGPFFHKIKNAETALKGMILESKINYFF